MTRPGVRRGYVLPFVIVAVAAAGMLAMAFVTAAYRASRAGALAGHTDRAHAAADEALALALGNWSADSLWLDAPGTTRIDAFTTSAGIPVRVEWVRSAPLVAWIRVETQVGSGRVHDRARRELIRAMRLEPPPLHVPAALVSSGPVYGANGSLLSGSDLTLLDSPCGTIRDTLSVPSAAASRVEPEAGQAWGVAGASGAVTSAEGDALDADVHALAARLQSRQRDSSFAPLPDTPASADAHRWRALSLAGAALNLRSPAPWYGLLVLRGPVALAGELTMQGLLVVDGPLDARAARLRVRGAVIVADPARQGTHLGSDSQVLYDRCAVQMALATVSRPASRPFFLWQRLSD